ncbi:MAG: hypothetical protein WC825_07705 [Gallionellaceae bacterium]|jgi:hypothetical protein
MLSVKAAPGLKIPLGHSIKNCIPEGRIVEVEETHYYQSMIKDGDLLLASADEWAAQQDADAKAEAAAIDAAAKVKAAEAAAAKAAAKQTATK